MLILFHVTSALASVAASTAVFFYPTKTRLYASYGLVGLTLASGTYLVLSTHARVLQACLMGVLYIGVVSVGLVSAHTKLAGEKSKRG